MPSDKSENLLLRCAWEDRLQALVRAAPTAATLSTDLSLTTYPAVLLPIFEQGQSGALISHEETGRMCALAIQDGRPVAVWCRDGLQEVAALATAEQQRGAASQASLAAATTLEALWAGLAQLVGGDVPTEALWQRYDRQQVVQLLNLRQGELSFVPTPEGHALAPILQDSLEALLHERYASYYALDADTLSYVVAPLFKTDGALQWRDSPKKLEAWLSAVSPALIRCAQSGDTPAALADLLERMPPNDRTRVLADIASLCDLGLLKFRHQPFSPRLLDDKPRRCAPESSAATPQAAADPLPAQPSPRLQQTPLLPMLWLLITATLLTVALLGHSRLPAIPKRLLQDVAMGIGGVAGIVGLFGLQKPWRAFAWRPSSVDWTAAGIGVAATGVAVLGTSPSQTFAGLALQMPHVVAEELLFRGFITCLLVRQCRAPFAATILSAIVYAAATLLYTPINAAHGANLRHIGLTGVFAGYPLAALLVRRMTLLSPLLLHLALAALRLASMPLR